MNHQYVKSADVERLARELEPRIVAAGGDLEHGPPLASVVDVLRERSQTLVDLTERALMFYTDIPPAPEVLAQHVTAEAKPALRSLSERFAGVEPWAEQEIQAAFEAELKASGLKMPKLAMPVRAAVFGTTQTPSVYVTLALAGKARVLDRLRRYAG